MTERMDRHTVGSMRTFGRGAFVAAMCGAAVAAAGSVGVPTASAEVCTPKFTSSGSSFTSRICGMPDYDQRRTAATLQGDGRTLKVSGLVGNGSCHCVPAAFTNLLGYYVGKGVAGSYPSKFNWDGRPGYIARPSVPAGTYLNGQPFSNAEVQAYNAATFAIGALGIDVKTGSAGCGTSWGTVLKYFNLLGPLFPQVYLATYTLTLGKNAPKDVANILAAGGTAAIAYGRYDGYSEANGQATWGTRTGGHALTVRGVQGFGVQAKLELSDPASNADPVENGDNDRFRQSTFATSTSNLTRVFNPVKSVYRWRMDQINPSGTTRVWDGALIAIPVMAVMAQGSSVKLAPGLAFNKQAAAVAGSEPIPSELKPRTFGTGGRVLDAAFLPGTGEIAYLNAGSNLVHALGVGSGEKRVIGRGPLNATQLETDPTGTQIFVGGSRELLQMDPQGTSVARTKLTSPVQALAFDPGHGLQTGRIVSVTADRNVRRSVPGTLVASSSSRLATSLVQGSGPLAATVDTSGRLVLRRGSSRRVAIAGGVSRRRTLSRLGGAGGLAIGDRGTLFSVVAGKLVELTAAGAPVRDSPFAGQLGAGRVVQVMRSGSDVPAERANEIIDQPVVDPDFPEMAP